MKRFALPLFLALSSWVMADNFIFLGNDPRFEKAAAPAPCPTCEKTQTAPTVATVAPLATAYWVQIGAFKQAAGAQQTIDRASKAGWAARGVERSGLTRVVIGPFSTSQEAATVLKAARQMEPKAFIRRGF